MVIFFILVVILSFFFFFFFQAEDGIRDLTVTGVQTCALPIFVADNIRKAIQAKELLKRSTNEKLGRITASFGVAAFRKGDTPSALVERTDRCLYAAKHAGRDKVMSETDLKAESTAAA